MEHYPGGKHYLTYDTAMKRRFGKKIIKLSLNAGFTCPNRDGSKGTGGCIFCTASGSGDFSGNAMDSIAVQLQKEAARMRSKWPEHSTYIAYFQANTNTYTTVRTLSDKCAEALHFPGVVGITLATRADCLSMDMLDYLSALSKETFLTVELGLQTVHDHTARLLNRGHTLADFLSGYAALQERNIPVTVHLINGLPGESEQDMLQSARLTASLRPAGVKLHMLHIMENTPLAALYRKKPFPLLTRDAYVSLVCRQIAMFSSDTVIERVTGDGDSRFLIAPDWTRAKRSVLGAIDRCLRDHNLYEGDLFDPAQEPFITCLMNKKEKTGHTPFEKID